MESNKSSYIDDNPKTLTGVTKAPIHLVPPVAIAYAAMAFKDGADKYGAYNWRDHKVSSSIYYAGLMRHMGAWWDGEDAAEDSKQKHLGHAIACLSILLDAEANGTLNDDRPTKGSMSKVLEELKING
jgi:hypothetical protein